MKTLQYAGFTGPESYAAIKAISKKKPEKVLPLKARFIDGFTTQAQGDDGNCSSQQAEKMAGMVWQIIDDTTSYLFNSSHSVCVALDSLYGAFAKAHYPLQYYTILLSNYAAKADKERIALVKEEMKKGFGIRVVPCRFRQDNRDFFLDPVNNTIADALTSVKFVSQRVADALFEMKDRTYLSFIDLLYDMELHPAFDVTNIEVLIRMGYFEEFGTAGRLLKIFHLFKYGENKFSKSHVQPTQQKRLQLLRREAEEITEELIPMPEQVRFEVNHLGTVLSTFPERKAHFAVLEVDDRYSPKLRLYNLETGAVGVMKIKKAEYNASPLQAGDVIHLLEWDRRRAYEFVAGVSRPKTGVMDLWIREYVKLA